MYSFAVYVVNSMATAGKDTFVRFVKEFSDGVFVVHRLSTIDRVNEIICRFGWDGVTKDEAYRLFASRVKTAWAEYCDGPNVCLYRDIEDTLAWQGKGKRHIFFVFCREPEEIAKIKQHFGDFMRTIFIDNPAVMDITSNPSDANVRNYEYDYLIKNEGTLDELRTDAQEFCRIIRDTVKYYTEEEIMSIVDLNNYKKVEAAKAGITSTPANTGSVTVEPGSVCGLTEGNVIVDIAQDLSSVNITNPNYEIVMYSSEDGEAVDFTKGGEKKYFRELNPGDLFSTPDDANHPARVYQVLNPVILWQKAEGLPFTYTAAVVPVYDPTILLKEDLAIGSMICKQSYAGITIFSKENEDKPVVYLGIDVLRQMQEWYGNIMQ